MKKTGVILAAILLLGSAAFAAPGKDVRVKYGKNIYFEGEADRNVPGGVGALFLKLDKDRAEEIVNGVFRDNVIDDGSARMPLASGETAFLDGQFVFLIPQEKDPSHFELLMESGTIKVAGDVYKVSERITFNVAVDEFHGYSFRSESRFYSTLVSKMAGGTSFGYVSSPGSVNGVGLTRVDSLLVNGEMYYPIEDGLWRKWLNKTDYVNCSRDASGGSFVPVSIHRVNPNDGGVVDSDLPGGDPFDKDVLYSGTIVYPDNSSYKGTFSYKVSVDVRYQNGNFVNETLNDTWTDGLNVSEIERERLRKIERIRQEVENLITSADTTIGTFLGRRYLAIKDADRISYQNTPAWIFHINYLNWSSRSKVECLSDKVLIYAVDEETGGFGETLYEQEVVYGSGSRLNYIEKSGKIYIWGEEIPKNYESFTEILSGYDVALRGEISGLRYLYFDGNPESLKKELCNKVGVPYVAPVELPQAPVAELPQSPSEEETIVEM